MKTLLILPDAPFAGHCTTGGSDKVWGACLARVVDEDAAVQGTAPPETPASPVWYICAYGRRGAQLRVECQELPLLQARVLLQKKSQEKAGKGYRGLAFSSFLPSFGTPMGMPLRRPVVALPSAPQPEPSPLPAPPSLSSFHYASASVKAVTRVQRDMLLANVDDYGVTEKVDGERCLVAWNGDELRAYNRKSQLASTVPPGANVLVRLGEPFVVDGERLTGGPNAGCYVLFDVLQLDGEDLQALPYRKRLTRLARALHQAGLVRETALTPTLRTALANSTMPDLAVLLAVTGEVQTRSVLEEVERAGGEGVVLRQLSGSYATCASKWKFTTDMDVCILGIQQGSVAGSLIMGLVRPSDGALIEVGRVRSGLTNQDVLEVAARLALGERPVFRVEYLPARTVGIALVEPRTSMAWLRTDKTWQECLTTQFAPEKEALIAAAKVAAV